jgi:8-oxo-dGTP diphosphatase
MADKFSVTDIFLHDESPLTPRHAVGAIILNSDGHVLLQLRDNIEGIFFPNHWGCFGGAIEPDETNIDALYREIKEELSITIKKEEIEPFITISFDPTMPSKEKIGRYFFVVRLSNETIDNIQLTEGKDFSFFPPDEVMKLTNLAPYDRFGLWLYFNQNRLSE